MLVNEAINHIIVEDLYQQGWTVQPHYFDPDLIQPLAAEAKQLYQSKQMTRAGIGRGALLQQNAAIRGDSIHWLQHDSVAQQHYQHVMEALRQTLNHNLFLGLFELEAHYAVYDAGAFYKKHIDSFKGAASRVVTVVTYLNSHWPDEAGGELVIYAPEGDAVIQTVPPHAGTLVVFLSEKIPHEVKVTQQQRLSIAGWFRLNSPV
jgi:SM-20-related protein